MGLQQTGDTSQAHNGSLPLRIVRYLSLVAAAFMLVWGAVCTIFPLKPFWRDEWCIMHNIKFKSAAELLGPLDFTQQFPRVYLHVFKWLAHTLNYSYTSWRLPSFLSSVCCVALLFWLMQRIFGKLGTVKYLFPLLVIADKIFVDYQVQSKHYVVEILMALVAIAQLHLLMSVGDTTRSWSRWRYALLCLSFLVCPFFSYTYPLAVLPLFVVVPLFCRSQPMATWFWRLFPLALCTIAVGVFYWVDIAQLMSDKQMHAHWQWRKTMSTGLLPTLVSLWSLFANLGSGLLFEIMLGAVALVAFGLSAGKVLPQLFRGQKHPDVFVTYSVALISLLMLVFFTGKFPMGEAKFTAFSIPALAIMVTSIAAQLGARNVAVRWAAVVLSVGVVGNIVNSTIIQLVDVRYQKRLHIMSVANSALAEARRLHVPILVTPDVSFPDDLVTPIPFLSAPSAAGVLKTFAAYHLDDSVPVFTIATLLDRGRLEPMLQARGATAYLAGDGTSFTLYHIQ